MDKPQRLKGELARHLSYANVVSTLALLFAMTGGALAASHYLITSTKQIKPSVLKKLKGAPAPSYSAGAGLTLTGRQFSLNPITVPAAFPGAGCAAGDVLQTAAAGGSATCISDHAYSATSGSQSLTGSQTSVVHVPAGNWVVVGNALGDADANGSISCTLNAGATAFDESAAVTQSTAPYAPIGLSGTVTTTGSSTAIDIYCTATSVVEM